MPRHPYSYAASVQRFLAECGTLTPAGTVDTIQCYRAYDTWADQHGVRPARQVVFQDWIKRQGVRVRRRGPHAEYVGLQLRGEPGDG